MSSYNENVRLFVSTTVFEGKLSGGSVVKNAPANAGVAGLGFDPWVGKIPSRRQWQPIPVVLPEKSHGQRSLVGCSPCLRES